MVNKALPMYEVIYPFLDFIRDQVLVGNNITLDFNFINAKLYRLNKSPLENYYVDTLQIQRKN